METEKLILNRISRLRVPVGKSAEEALALLKSRIAEGRKDVRILKKSKQRTVYWVSSIAAGFLILFAVWQIWFRPDITQVIAEKGSHKEYKLPDGSVVNLNADSKISFPAGDFKNNRHLTLEGEAFFTVTKGSGFTVSTSSGKIIVLGTSFNVYARDNSFTVSCFTGRVLVSAAGRSVTINPGESSTLAGNELVSFADADISKATAWLNGEFNFVNAPLNLVFDEMGRQFNVNFSDYNFSNKFFTGSFSNKDLQVALDIVCSPMGLKYEISSNAKIFIAENPE